MSPRLGSGHEDDAFCCIGLNLVRPQTVGETTQNPARLYVDRLHVPAQLYGVRLVFDAALLNISHDPCLLPYSGGQTPPGTKYRERLQQLCQFGKCFVMAQNQGLEISFAVVLHCNTWPWLPSASMIA